MPPPWFQACPLWPDVARRLLALVHQPLLRGPRGRAPCPDPLPKPLTRHALLHLAELGARQPALLEPLLCGPPARPLSPAPCNQSANPMQPTRPPSSPDTPFWTWMNSGRARMSRPSGSSASRVWPIASTQFDTAASPMPVRHGTMPSRMRVASAVDTTCTPLVAPTCGARAFAVRAGPGGRGRRPFCGGPGLAIWRPPRVIINLGKSVELLSA